MKIVPNSNFEEPSARFKIFWEAENALNCVLSVRRSGRFTMICLKIESYLQVAEKKNSKTFVSPLWYKERLLSLILPYTLICLRSSFLSKYAHLDQVLIMMVMGNFWFM